MKYQVTVRPVEETEAGHLQFLNRIEVVAIDPVGFNNAGNEVYEIEVKDADAGFVESQFEAVDGVVTYFQIASEPDDEDEIIKEELRQLEDETIFDDYPETEQEANHL
jgi:hypothetical protein